MNVAIGISPHPPSAEILTRNCDSSVLRRWTSREYESDAYFEIIITCPYQMIHDGPRPPRQLGGDLSTWGCNEGTMTAA